MITGPSSVISEAILFKKPILVLNYDQSLHVLPEEEKGVVYVARNKLELDDFLRRYFQEGDAGQVIVAAQRESYGYFAGTVDGDSSNRIKKYILNNGDHDGGR